MDPGAARYFTSAVHEFAQSIGKENSYQIAEITGSREFAYRTLEQVGMDAALGLADVQDQMEWLVKGFRDPREYFGLFRHSHQLGKDSHTWFRNRVVTAFDDHDQVRKGTNKARFAADDLGRKLGVAAIAFNAATLGIPCLYYGSEQGLDGSGPNDR
jgi:glycosidase